MTTGCTVCGRPSGRLLRSLRGELTCVTHATGVRCAFCGRPSGDGEPGWSELFPPSWRCPSCAADAVDTPEELRRHVSEVRRGTRELGFGLTARVRVTFANTGPARADLGGRHAPGTMLAYTEMLPTEPRSADVVAVRVLSGLPGFVFGRAVAHEVGHAWLAQAGARPRRPEVEEGVCELVAYAWLKRSNLPFAEAVRQTVRQNPDPTYGAGFREVHAAVRQHGLTAVLAGLTTHGDLPTGSVRAWN